MPGHRPAPLHAAPRPGARPRRRRAQGRAACLLARPPPLGIPPGLGDRPRGRGDTAGPADAGIPQAPRTRGYPAGPADAGIPRRPRGRGDTAGPADAGIPRRLREEGWGVNRKRVQRLRREEGLRVPVKRRKRQTRNSTMTSSGAALALVGVSARRRGHGRNDGREEDGNREERGARTQVHRRLHSPSRRPSRGLVSPRACSQSGDRAALSEW